MIGKILRLLSTPAVLAALIYISIGPTEVVASPGQANTGPDGTPLACNFSFPLKGGPDWRAGVDSLDSSTDCDSYHIYLTNHPTDRSQSTFRISEKGSTGSMTYHLADMPLDEPLLLLTPEKQPTRVLARRGLERMNFVVGNRPFIAPPPKSLLPRSSSRVERAVAPQTTRPAGAQTEAPARALIGSWRTAGAILELRADGTFSKVSNSSFGTFGGVIGVDDNGKFEVRGESIVFRGMLRERTCPYSLTPRNELVVCDVQYHRE